MLDMYACVAYVVEQSIAPHVAALMIDQLIDDNIHMLLLLMDYHWMYLQMMMMMQVMMVHRLTRRYRIDLMMMVRNQMYLSLTW